MKWIPIDIVVGISMKNEEENLAICLAKEAGIKNIYNTFINEKSELDQKKRSYVQNLICL